MGHKTLHLDEIRSRGVNGEGSREVDPGLGGSGSNTVPVDVCCCRSTLG